MTGMQLRMPAAHNTISPASSLVLKLLSIPVFFVLPTTMPPLPGFDRLHQAGHFVSNRKYGQVIEVSLIILVSAIVIRLAVVYFSQRKSQASVSSADNSEKFPTKPILERQDSAVCCQKHWESDHKHHLDSLQQEIVQRTQKPIHPWILPPQALPGPYDPMYYPLPPPTLRPTSTRVLMSKPEGRHSSSYTRLVPATGAPPHEARLYGTMTTSTRGWRRTHWNVAGG